MSAVIPTDTLLMAMEEQETDFAKKDILRAAREELEAMADDVAWVHVLISYYADHHEEGLRSVKYMSRKDGEDKIAKFCRNRSFADALTKKYPWLLMTETAPAGEIDGFDKAYRVTEATAVKIQELIPRPMEEVSSPGDRDIRDDDPPEYEAPIESPPVVSATTAEELPPTNHNNAFTDGATD